MKGLRIHYAIDGKEYCGEVLDVLHVPVQVEAPAGLVTASQQRQQGLAVASYVWVACLSGVPITKTGYNVRMLPLGEVTVCDSPFVDGRCASRGYIVIQGQL